MSNYPNDADILIEHSALPPLLVSRLRAAGYVTQREVIMSSDYELLSLRVVGQSVLSKVREVLGRGFFDRDIGAKQRSLVYLATRSGQKEIEMAVDGFAKN